MNVTINKNKNKSKNSKLNSLIKMLQILGKETLNLSHFNNSVSRFFIPEK